ncbi:MAG: hypothetical protein U0168_23995 [Nannocystaceae bacterium]
MDEPEVATGPDDEPTFERTRSRTRPGTPWSRILLGATLSMPALAFGGVHALTTVGFCALALLLWLRLCLRSRKGLQLPLWGGLGLLAAAVTFVQWLPLPGLREALAPGIDTAVQQALAGTGVTARAGLSPVPGDTGLEVARLLGLTALFVAAAQLSWRVTAAFVTLLGTVVALVGFAHEAAGLHAIYGWYTPIDIDRATVPALLGTFVNPNHQSGLLLLGIFSGVAVAADQHAHGLVTADPGRVDRYGDRFLAAMAGVTIQIPALVLSLSRGALVAFLLLGPIAAVLALRRQAAGRRARRRRSERLSPARIMVLVGAAGLFLLVARHGAWRELATLSSLSESLGETDHKLAHAMRALGLIGLSPLLGIGRGAFIDMFPALRVDDSHVLATHLECAPAAMLVEWGPWFGGTILAGMTAWWLLAMLRGGRHSDDNARRIVLLGLLAVALQNTVDFAFEFLGVTAPAVALAGALASGPVRPLAQRTAAVAGGALLLGAMVLGLVSRPGSQLLREDDNAAIVAGTGDAALALARRPLDGRLHGLLARQAARKQDWPEALARADAAVRLRPASVDPWLIRGVALRRSGRVPEGDESIARGSRRCTTCPAVPWWRGCWRSIPSPPRSRRSAPSPRGRGGCGSTRSPRSAPRTPMRSRPHACARIPAIPSRCGSATRSRCRRATPRWRCTTRGCCDSWCRATPVRSWPWPRPCARSAAAPTRATSCCAGSTRTRPAAPPSPTCPSGACSSRSCSRPCSSSATRPRLRARASSCPSCCRDRRAASRGRSPSRSRPSSTPARTAARPRPRRERVRGGLGAARPRRGRDRPRDAARSCGYRRGRPCALRSLRSPCCCP